MPTLPHDVPDLYLAPVVLALETRIEELAQLDVDALSTEVAVVSNTAGWTRELREAGLLQAVRYLIDCHGWTLSWDPRGLRLTHGRHEVVLGVPATFTDYLAGAPHGPAHELVV